jgi:glycosyltransferase involved in cell wall biosynthesis
MIPLAIACAVVAACCFAGSVALQHGAVREAGPSLSLRRVVRQPRWLAGTFLGVAAASLHVTALSLAPLVIVQPIGVLSLVVTLRARRRWPLLAVCLGVTGVVAVASVGGTSPGELRPLLVQPFVLVAILVFIVGRGRCLPLAAAAAMLFGSGSALVKVASHDILTGHLVSGAAAESVLLILAGGWVVHQAYAAGPVATVIAVTTVVDPLTAVVIGLWCYGEAPHVTPFALLPFAALAAWGVVVLTRQVPQPFPLPKETDMRILIAADTYPPDVNGAAHFTARLARGLAARGNDVHVVCPSDTGRPTTESDGVLTVHRTRSLRTPFHPTFRYSTPWRAAREVEALVAGLRPDVVHVQSHFSVSRATVKAAVARDLPVIATNHFMPENLLGFAPLPAAAKAWLANWAWRDLVRVFQRASVVTSPTQRAVDLLKAQGFPGQPLAISCGVDLEHYAAVAEPRSDPPTVLFVGRLDKEKKVHELLRALRFVPDLDAEIVGNGSCREELGRLALRLGVDDRVRFHGLLSDQDLVRAYRRCDIFCMPGTAELQSIATMEAMAAGLPVVAADAMALPHLVRPGVNGFLYPPGSVDQLAGALAQLAADPQRRVVMGRAGREMVAEHGLGRTLDAFEGLYRTLSRVDQTPLTLRAVMSAEPESAGGVLQAIAVAPEGGDLGGDLR